MAKWIFLGDDSRKIFASKLLQIPLEEITDEKSLTIIRGEKIFAQETMDENNLIISSYFVPPATEIFLPSYSDDMRIAENHFDNCAVFEMYPFGKESTENFIKLFIGGSDDPAVLFVMMDVVDEDEDSPVGIDAMKKIFLRKNRDIMIFRDDSDILKILHWHKPLAADIITSIRRELQGICSRADNILQDYDNFISEQKENGCLSETAENKIVSFDSVKGQNHIWISYKNAAEKVFFVGKNSGIKNLFALYRQTIFQKNSLAAMIWNVSTEENKLEEKLRKKFEEVMQTPRNFQSLLNRDENYSAHIYRALIRQGGRFGGVDKAFLSVYENFLSKSVRRLFTAEIDAHIRELKNFLDERGTKLLD
ncbi:MAG: hypothetical protein IK062_08835 [Selenomonadaceae bacterium]|nr:hypothetical protein [Selenomonadaceae bacterium]